jgi:hypothetical protein
MLPDYGYEPLRIGILQTMIDYIPKLECLT